jgi:tRNA threonylcarbamoyladenosine biosynthesis protein TsaB
MILMYILNIETATKNCSVALAKDGNVLAYRELAETGFAHAEKLHIFIAEVLYETQVAFYELHAIAVSKGPGSYTGLRIGVSAAKGLCFALDIPLIAVDTLLVLSKAVHESDGLFLPMIDARRMEVYCGLYDSNGNKLQETSAKVVTVDAFSEITDKVYYFGDGAAKCQGVLNGDNFKYLKEPMYPSARDMASLSFEAIKIGNTENVAYFEPFYLKDFNLTS